MKHYFTLILFLVLFTFCERTKKYSPSDYLDSNMQDDIILKIMPYLAKKPAEASNLTKFDSIYVDYYLNEKKSKEYKLLKYHIELDTHYFLITRIAPSLYQKKIAIGGKFLLVNNTIKFYEEKFWTFKMAEENLSKKSDILFNVMVENGDLSLYYPGKIPNEEWIEFPDEKTYYDKSQNLWKFVWEK